MLGLAPSAEKVQEGCVLCVLESRRGESFGGSVRKRGHSIASAEEAPRVEPPCGLDVLFLCEGGSEPFSVDSLTS